MLVDASTAVTPSIIKSRDTYKIDGLYFWWYLLSQYPVITVKQHVQNLCCFQVIRHPRCVTWSVSKSKALQCFCQKQPRHIIHAVTELTGSNRICIRACR